MSSNTLFNRLKQVTRPTEYPVAEEQKATDAEKPGLTTEEKSASPSDADSEEFTPDAQAGVKAMEATTKVWSKSHLIIAYIM